jgi:hypothetical protein
MWAFRLRGFLQLPLLFASPPPSLSLSRWFPKLSLLLLLLACRPLATVRGV